MALYHVVWHFAFISFRFVSIFHFFMKIADNHTEQQQQQQQRAAAGTVMPSAKHLPQITRYILIFQEGVEREKQLELSGCELCGGRVEGRGAATKVI